jgi:hypothetical protein
MKPFKNRGPSGRVLALALSIPVATASAAPCAVWPDRILRVNNEGASNLLFILRSSSSPENPVTEVGGVFKKRDPSNQCRGSTSAVGRDVNAWVETPAIAVSSRPGQREDSLTFYLGSVRAPFLYEGVFYVDYKNGEREWLNNPGDDKGNFWFTLESTTSLPQSSSWDFDLMRVPRTAEIAHWSNPARCL